MSSLEAGVLVAAVVLVGLPSAYLLIRRAQRAESTRARLVREAHERADTAREMDPDALVEAVRAEVNDHLIRYLLDNPAVAEGFARLRQAARDDRTNTTEGDA